MTIKMKTKELNAMFSLLYPFTHGDGTLRIAFVTLNHSRTCLEEYISGIQAFIIEKSRKSSRAERATRASHNSLGFGGRCKPPNGVQGRSPGKVFSFLGLS